MSLHAYDVSASDFQEKVIEASHRVPVIVDFWAPWCEPCKILKPILEKLAQEYQGRFILAKLNSDENQGLALRYGVRGIPNIKAFVAGEVVDEFTGALPESGVREFLDGLLPSPAEPLRQQALAALTKGDAPAARQLLEQALAADPRLFAAQLDLAELDASEGQLEEAQRRLDTLTDSLADSRSNRDPHEDRIAAITAQIKLAAAGAGADIASLSAQLTARPEDLDARLRLANALALRQDYRAALEHLLEIVRRDRKFGDDAGRKTMLTLFALLASDPKHDELVREFRVALARTIN
jgi:putative thioredoxin